MKKIWILGLVSLCFSCSEHKQQQVDAAISNTADSVVAKLNDVNDSLTTRVDSLKSKLPKIEVSTYAEIPITLQWIGWDKPGKAKVTKGENGWYDLEGQHFNAQNEFLKIRGKIKRTDETHLAFDGTIITYIKYNNGGKPCEKKGKQIFAKTGTRKYYRLQGMGNCEGNRVVDYVDLFEMDSVL